MQTVRKDNGARRKFTNHELQDMGERAALIGLPCEFPYGGEQARGAWEQGWRSVPEKKRGMLKVKYVGRIPKSIRDWCDKHPERVREVAYGDGYCTESGMAYDVSLRSGWRNYDEVVHGIIEGTVADTLRRLRWAEPCDCEDCEKGKNGKP